MRTRSIGGSAAVFVLAAAMIGCGSKTKDRCEALCDWINRCNVSTEKLSCSDSAIDQCVDDYKAHGDSCQDAFDAFADCLDAHDKCEDVESSCVNEGNAYTTKCVR